eukprot:77294_1
MAQAAQYIWDDSPQEIWNAFKPPTYYYSLSDVYPGFVIIVVFTLIHLFMDKLLHPNAKFYANKVAPLNTPEWIAASKHALQLKYAKISHIPVKKFAKMMKKFELNSTQQQQQLISYQKQCNAHAKHISKYQEASFKVVIFGLVYVYGLCIIFNDGKWFWDQKWMWAQPFPQHPGSHWLFNLDVYYALQIGYHGHRAVYQFFEYARRDFWAMFIHHWVTVFLLAGSKLTGYQQIGATVLLCNDNVDLLMPLAKLTEYTEHRTLQMIFTIAFIVLWIPMRIGVYFYKVIWSICVDGYLQFRHSAVNWICLVGLIIIYLLQFYWTKHLLNMVWTRLLKGKAIADTRSDDESSASIKKES